MADLRRGSDGGFLWSTGAQEAQVPLKTLASPLVHQRRGLRPYAENSINFTDVHIKSVLCPVNSIKAGFTIIFENRPLVLSIGHLKKLGALASDGAWWLHIGTRIEVRRVSEGRLNFTIPKYPPEEEQNYIPKDERFWWFHNIDYLYRELHFGVRPYFVCPITGDDCLKLVFYKGLVSSISAFKLIKSKPGLSRRAIRYEAQRAKLLKLDGTLRASDNERERLLTFLKRHPQRIAQDENIFAFLEREQRRTDNKRKQFLWESRPLSTTKALDCGLGAGQHLQFEEYMHKSLEWAESLPPIRAPAEPPAPDSIEFYPQLNIRILLDRGWFREDRVIGRRLGWQSDVTGVTSIYLFFDPRSEGMPLLIARIQHRDGDIVWQSIRLLPGTRSGKPRYVMCPITHLRSELMYFRNGLFASREAHGLYNPSQRAARKRDNGL